MIRGTDSETLTKSLKRALWAKVDLQSATMIVDGAFPTESLSFYLYIFFHLFYWWNSGRGTPSTGGCQTREFTETERMCTRDLRLKTLYQHRLQHFNEISLTVRANGTLTKHFALLYSLLTVVQVKWIAEGRLSRHLFTVFLLKNASSAGRY